MTTKELQGTVEKLVFGGEGLIRHNGLVIFVPGVIPGEEVKVEIVSEKKNFAKARLLSIVKPSDQRIQPRCPHFGVCGGCQLQHIAYPLHAEIKKNWLKEAFFHLFDTSIDFTPTANTFFWRRKITLHAERKGENSILGYFGLDNTKIIEIQECPLFFENTSPFTFLRNLLKLIPAKEEAQLEIELFKLPHGKMALRLIAHFSLRKECRDPILTRLKSHFFEKFALEFGTWSYSEGGFFDPILFSALGKNYYFSLQAFLQNHPQQGEQLWQDVVETTNRLEKKQLIYDLYAGVGVTAIALRNKGHEVIAIEGNKHSIFCGEKTCEKDLVKPTFICSSVEKALSALHTKATTWVLNPPRTGVSNQVIKLSRSLAPKHIIYISCSPATLARDVKEFIQAGWTLRSLRGYDMFPQTTHLESIALLSRSE